MERFTWKAYILPGMLDEYIKRHDEIWPEMTQVLNEAGIRPNWYAGISIGAINAAIIAGNRPQDRIERLRDFWETICEPAGLASWPAMGVRAGLSMLPMNPAL